MAIDVLAIDGTRLTGKSLRMAAFHATKRGNGIALPRDLQVRALVPNGPGVRIVPGDSGGGVLRNQFSVESAGQTYLTNIDVEEYCDIGPADNTGPKVSYVIQRIYDVAFGSQTRGAEFIEVNSLVGLNFPWIPLAKITLDANATTVTQDDIEDMRVVANPDITPVKRIRPINAGNTEDLTASRPNGEWFPNAGGEQIVHIPETATRVLIEHDWSGIRYAAGNFFGWMWIEWGPGVGGLNGTQDRQFATQRSRFDSNAAGNAQRAHWTAGDDMYIPREFRGTDQSFIAKARYDTTGMSGVRIDGGSTVKMGLTFLEVADPSTS